MKPLIATPCLGFSLCLNYHESILKLSMASRERSDVELSFLHLGHISMIHLARNMCAKFMLEGPYSHLFFIDADIGFEPDNFFHFLDSGHDVVGGVCPRKEDGGPTTIPRPKTDDRFVEVDKAGTGFMCIRRNVFETLAEKSPDLVYQNEDETLPSYRFFDTWRHLGEDFTFCARWKSAGGKIFADTKAKFSHQGVKVYTEEP